LPKKPNTKPAAIHSGVKVSRLINYEAAFETLCSDLLSTSPRFRSAENPFRITYEGFIMKYFKRPYHPIFPGAIRYINWFNSYNLSFRDELPTTSKLLLAIASAANNGLITPATASGMATIL